jgi:glutamyl-tRNA synthetase
LNFVYTLLSKRKLNWFVANGKVSGWDDPRFPTIRGILRRGLTVEALRKYMMMQGPSKNTVLLEWDKIWSVNKKIIDLQAPRFTALFANSLCSVEVLGEEASNYSLPQTKSILKHKKNEKLGSKTMVFYKQLLFEQADAKEMQVGEEITLMDWGNAFVRSVERDESTGIVSEITIELNLKGDVKKTKKKVTWISNVETNIVPLIIHDYDYLITKKKLGEGEKFEDCLNPVTEIVHQAIGDGNFSSVRPGDIFQIERKDFFICDSVAADAVHIIPIPDGKKKK